MIETKNNKIKDSLNKTKIKRKSQTVFIIKTKIDTDKLNRNTQVNLKKLFLEAKWLYNYIINRESLILLFFVSIIPSSVIVPISTVSVSTFAISTVPAISVVIIVVLVFVFLFTHIQLFVGLDFLI